MKAVNILKITLLILIILFTSSMSVKNSIISNIDYPVRIDLAGLVDNEINMTLSEIVNDIKYIKLESRPGCYINRISKIILTENYIFILSGGTAFGESILMFENSGKFVRHIGMRGKGPGEYSNIVDMQVDSQNEIIYLLDQQSRKLLLYSFDGKYLRSIYVFKSPYAQSFVLLKDNNLLMFQSFKSIIDSNNTQFKLYDNEGAHIWNFPEINDRVVTTSSAFGDAAYYHEENNFVEFTTNYCDTIYRMSALKKYEAIYYYDFGKYRCPDNLFQDHYRFQKSRSNYLLKSWECITQQYIFTHFTIHDDFYLSIYHRKDAKFIYNTKYKQPKQPIAGLINDLDGGPPFWPARYKDGRIISLQYASQIKSVLDNVIIDQAEFKDPDLRQNLLEFRKNLSAEDGPVIIEITLK